MLRILGVDLTIVKIFRILSMILQENFTAENLNVIVGIRKSRQDSEDRSKNQNQCTYV